jgi:hypothetical protein
LSKKWNNPLHIIVDNEQLEACFLTIGRGDTKPGRRMAALVLEAYGALCFFASAVFLAWAAVAKLRPDLDEDEFDSSRLRSLSSF